MKHPFRPLPLILLCGATLSTANPNLVADIWGYKNRFDAAAQANRLAEVASIRSTSASSSSSASASASAQSSSAASSASLTDTLNITSTSTSGSLTSFTTSSPASQAGSTTSPSFVIYTANSLPDDPSLPSACATALTASISCNFTIQYMSNIVFNVSDLQFMCTSDCSNSLTAYRRTIASSCSGITFNSMNNQTYPATLAIDTLSEPYFSQCRKDPTSGQFCQAVMSTFTPTNPSQGVLGYPQNELCTACMLGMLNTTLSYAYTFTSTLYGTLQSALTECGSSWFGYNVTTPGQTGGGSSGGSSDNTFTPTCSFVGHNITLSSQAACTSIAQQNSVTVQDILLNNLVSVTACTAGLPSGTELCLPQPCTVYTVQGNQTCDNIVADVNARGLAGNGVTITNAQLSSFNEGLLSNCANLNLYPTLCVSPHGGFTDVGNAGGSQVPNSSPTATIAPPGPTVSGTTADCGAWYFVQPGNICQQVALNNSITLEDLVRLNPEINGNCTNLWANYYYCVAPYPPFTATSAGPTFTANSSDGAVATLPFTTATTPMTTQSLASATGIPAPTNVAVGTITSGCSHYYTMQDGFNCSWIEEYFNITSTEFMSYNSDPGAPCPGLTVGEAYCVSVLNATDAIPPVPQNAASGSGPHGCQLWYTVVSGDGCTSIEQKFGLSPSQFFTLNPEVKTDCTNLGSSQAYCVRAIGQMSAAVPPNAVAGTDNWDCAKYDTVVSGDSCASIESRNSISSALFLALNPEVFPNCTNIQLGGAYCVAAVPTYTLSSTTGATTPTNVASGTDTHDCAKYDTVVSGDSCPVIEARNNVSDALFRALNPEINSACTNLILGGAYCVAALPGHTPTQTLTTPTSTPTGPPSNLAVGSWKNCTSYYTIVSGDNCNAIDQTFKISFTDFLVWNPEVNVACTNIGLAAAYCVAATPKKCSKLYTVASGDFCSRIESNNGITHASFLALNPWIDSNCDLQVGQNVCVGSVQ